MGAEVLEESVFEPFFTELEPLLSGKKVALFGSYGWGDGQWMRDWQDRAGRGGVFVRRGSDSERGARRHRSGNAPLSARRCPFFKVARPANTGP
jgi:hypothetical protein